MNLFLLHASGLAWDELGLVIIPATAAMAYFLMRSKPEEAAESDEDNEETVPQPAVVACGDGSREG